MKTTQSFNMNKGYESPYSKVLAMAIEGCLCASGATSEVEFDGGNAGTFDVNNW